MVGGIFDRTRVAPRNEFVVLVRPGTLSEFDNATRSPCTLGTFEGEIPSEMGGKAVILVAL